MKLIKLPLLFLLDLFLLGLMVSIIIMMWTHETLAIAYVKLEGKEPYDDGRP